MKLRVVASGDFVSKLHEYSEHFTCNRDYVIMYDTIRFLFPYLEDKLIILKGVDGSDECHMFEAIGSDANGESKTLYELCNGNFDDIEFVY